MFNSRAAAPLIAALLLFGETAQAEEKEPAAVVAIGPEGEWAFPGTFGIGPSASVEFGVIKDWLEIEVGAGTLFRRSQTEWESDVLFKKPFTLSDNVEFMVGAGPTWSYSTGETGKTGAAFALDFMFWPWPERKFGWFLEPTYTYSLSKDHEKSLAVSAGLLIAIP